MSSGPPHEPIGADPNFNAAPRLIGTTWAMTTLSTVFVLMRLYTRAVIVKKVALDDYILIVATVNALHSITFSEESANDKLVVHVANCRISTSLVQLGTRPSCVLSTA